jgi:hypothetical protein
MKNDKLDLKWDVPLKKFGKEFEEIQPGELKLNCEEYSIPLLLTTNGVVDAFDIAFGSIREIWFDDIDKIKQTIDFHFEGEYYSPLIDTNNKPQTAWQVWKPGGYSMQLIYTPKLLESANRNNYIHNMKYLYEGEVINIRVYCPVKYSEASTFLDQWYEKIRKIN